MKTWMSKYILKFYVDEVIIKPIIPMLVMVYGVYNLYRYKKHMGAVELIRYGQVVDMILSQLQIGLEIECKGQPKYSQSNLF